MASYIIRTWDWDAQTFTPQVGVPEGPWSKWGLRTALRLLRGMGYDGDRMDHSIWVERVDEGDVVAGR